MRQIKKTTPAPTQGRTQVPTRGSHARTLLGAGASRLVHLGLLHHHQEDVTADLHGTARGDFGALPGLAERLVTSSHLSTRAGDLDLVILSRFHAERIVLYRLSRRCEFLYLDHGVPPCIQTSFSEVISNLR